ncbi:hypothetical protein HYC85_020340 [Camellia sinensis]|uniref:RRM domain-containing protein n=1 Tax=Camellia sinensis TaxID=4442 RepID=A0A7J7GTD2_CAMSI|nr:hypothetical protein HYC85_020340 [Camellia sinensis]
MSHAVVASPYFPTVRSMVLIKVIRNKITSQPKGYGFVEFNSHAAAERVLQTYNGTQMPGTEQTLRLNWASFGIGERRPDARPEHSIFVGDLAPDVTDYLLQETFRTQYPSVRGAKVVTDPNTGRSKGYGFVKFADEMERNHAMSEMNGKCVSVRQHQRRPLAFNSNMQQLEVFFGNLDPNVTEKELRQIFLQFGEIIYVKIPTSRGCGFVQFTARASAEEAIQWMRGTMIGQQAVHLSWGRSPTAKQVGTMILTKQYRCMHSTSCTCTKGHLTEDAIFLIFQHLNWNPKLIAAFSCACKWFDDVAKRVLWKEFCKARAPKMMLDLQSSGSHRKSFLLPQCRTDVLYVSDPCEHLDQGEEGDVGFFRGVFKSFAMSKVRKMLISRGAKFHPTEVCPYCKAKLWSMLQAKMVPQSASCRLGSYEDAIEYYVCLNGHVLGTYLDQKEKLIKYSDFVNKELILFSRMLFCCFMLYIVIFLVRKVKLIMFSLCVCLSLYLTRL